jgi:serine/threonine protein kinase
LHAHGILHRDIAARNVLISDSNRGLISDFGLARIVDIDCGETTDASTHSYYRVTGGSKLPIRWMAPESLRDKKFTRSSDVWMLGVCYWQLITGLTTPYGDIEDNWTVQINVVSGDANLTDFRYLPEDVCPAELRTVLSHCLNPDPEERISASQLVIELRELLNRDYPLPVQRPELAMLPSLDNLDSSLLLADGPLDLPSLEDDPLPEDDSFPTDGSPPTHISFPSDGSLPTDGSLPSYGSVALPGLDQPILSVNQPIMSVKQPEAPVQLSDYDLDTSPHSGVLLTPYGDPTRRPK